jgi:hypothetical protein
MARTDPMSARGRSTPDGNGGRPEEAAEALPQTVAGPPATPAPDPDVSTALSLGWHLGELRAAVEPQRFAAPDTGSPADDYLARAGVEDRWQLVQSQVEAALGRLAGRIGDERLSSLGRTTDPRERYEQTLIALWAADAQLGRALGLGRLIYALTRLEQSEDAAAAQAEPQADATLAETQPLPEQETPVDTALRIYAPQVETALSDLATLLPRNAAHSVLNSLRLWWQEKELRQTAADGAVGFVSLDAELREQGDRWRSLLSAEVAARDVLRLRDNLGSIEGLSAQLWEVARGAIGKIWAVALGTAAVLLLGIVMLFFAPTRVPGAALVLAAFGLSWKGIGGFLGKPIALGGQDVRDAGLDWTIAYRITTLPPEAREGIARTLGMLRRGERRRWAHLDDLLKVHERPPAAAQASAAGTLLDSITGGQRK